MTECLPDTEKRWSCVTKTPGETKPVLLSAFGMCAQYWEPNEKWDVGEFAWPTTPCGFVAECTQAGWSGAKEPRFKTNEGVDTEFTDGSVVWTLRVPTLESGIQTVSNPSASAPAGIFVAGVIVIENTKIAVDYIGGVDGESYEILFTFDIAGRTRDGSQVVHVAVK